MATHPVWDVEPEPSVSIGVTEGDAPYLFEDVAAARLLRDGRIAVADRGPGVIRMFDGRGRFATEMGRRGEGPGEFEYISRLSVVGSDTLEVYDSSSFRFTRYLADGSFLGTLQVLGEDGYPEVYLGRFRDGSRAFAWIRQGPRPLGAIHADVMGIGRFDASGRMDRALGTATGMWRWEGPLYPFSPRFYGFTVGDSVFFTDGLSPELTIMDAEGTRVGELRLHDPPDRARDPWGVLAEALAAQGRQEELDLLGEVPHDSVPATAVVFRDTAGRIWAKEYSPATDSNWLGLFTHRGGGRWWVVDPGGDVLAEVRVPDGVIPLDALGDRLLGITRDEFDVQRVVVHRMRTTSVGGITQRSTARADVAIGTLLRHGAPF